MSSLDIDHLAHVLEIDEDGVIDSDMHLPMVNPSEVLPPIKVPDDDIQQLKNDAEYARDNLVELAEITKTVLAGAIKLAQTSERAREWEVVGGIIEKMTNVNLQIIDVHKKRVEIETKLEPEQPPQVVNNNTVAFVGTTAELLKKFREDAGLE